MGKGEQERYKETEEERREIGGTKSCVKKEEENSIRKVGKILHASDRKIEGSEKVTENREEK